MKRDLRTRLLLLSAVVFIGGCSNGPSARARASGEHGGLVGAWRSKIVFKGGPLAGMKDLEFLLAYNAGGTMTESSNYDEAPNSSPPAYGIWKQSDPRTFETKYIFFTTRAPEPADSAPGSSDWWPAGHGVISETITLAEDGQTYTSTIKIALFDKTDTPIAGGGEGTAAGTRIGF